MPCKSLHVELAIASIVELVAGIASVVLCRTVRTESLADSSSMLAMGALLACWFCR